MIYIRMIYPGGRAGNPFLFSSRNSLFWAVIKSLMSCVRSPRRSTQHRCGSIPDCHGYICGPTWMRRGEARLGAHGSGRRRIHEIPSWVKWIRMGKKSMQTPSKFDLDSLMMIGIGASCRSVAVSLPPLPPEPEFRRSS